MHNQSEGGSDVTLNDYSSPLKKKKNPFYVPYTLQPESSISWLWRSDKPQENGIGAQKRSRTKEGDSGSVGTWPLSGAS